MDRWINEPGFRADMRQDPEGTVRESGAELDADEQAALREIDWTLSDAELQARASKWVATTALSPRTADIRGARRTDESCVAHRLLHAGSPDSGTTRRS